MDMNEFNDKICYGECPVCHKQYIGSKRTLNHISKHHPKEADEHIKWLIKVNS